MSLRTPAEICACDASGPVEIAPDVYWVGHHLEGDPFQCHAYLVVCGDQSVLIDPGSRLSAAHTLAKVRQVLPLDQIRYFVCHHADPDIVGALDDVVAATGPRADAVVVTHGRTAALLKHLDLPVPLWLVEDHGWTLDLGGRALDFVFTPYMHFPGAFTTFDRETGVLFSSDIFGAIGDDLPLVATDLDAHFEAVRLFHEHYMPSREIVNWGLERLEALPLRFIAPQHGSMVPAPLIGPLVARLKALDCGLYLLSRGDTDLRRLSALNQHMRAVMKAIALQRDLVDVASPLLSLMQAVLPVTDLVFFVDDGAGGVLRLSRENHFRGESAVAPAEVQALFAEGAVPGAHDAEGRVVPCQVLLPGGMARAALAVPLRHPANGRVDGVALLLLRSAETVGPRSVAPLLEDLWVPLEAAIARERSLRLLERDRARVYEDSIRDPLTHLYNRTYMADQVERLLAWRQRDPMTHLALIFLDVDHFKVVNDTWGHLVGDDVLRCVAEAVRASCRAVDLPVRYGGEEFALFIWGAEPEAVLGIADRVRSQVAACRTRTRGAVVQVTASAGVAFHRAGQSREELVAAADRALYEAKQTGRDRVCVATTPEPTP